MLTQTYRPKRFSEIIGQTLPVAVMKSLVKDPNRAPRTFIFEGEYGTGKSSLARVVARALSCESKTSVEPCLNCKACDDKSLFTAAYQEYDITQVGNVDFMRALKSDLLYTGVTAPYRLVIFDESHTASKQAMSALLKVIEDVPDRTFFIFTTTEVEKMLSTIRSRSVELTFNPVADELVEKYIIELSAKEAITVTPDLVKRIVNRAGGHVRNALMMLELCKHIPVEEYSSSLFLTAEEHFLYFIKASLQGDKETCKGQLQLMLSQPLSQLHDDVDRTILNLTKTYVGLGEPGLYTEVSGMLAQNTFQLLKALSAPWASNAFKSDLLTQALFWYLFTLMKEFAFAKRTAAPADTYRK